MTDADSRDLLAFVARVCGAERAERGERIQSLWGGYGELIRVCLSGLAEGSSATSVVVKWARPPSRGSSGTSHARKCTSYDVETAFYETMAARCDDSCRVARLLGQRVRRADASSEWILVLEDLDDAGFSRRVRRPERADLDACLAWLASFHARFLGVRPEKLWEIGTYWHLATRPDELEIAAGRDPSLRSRAVHLDRQLRAARSSTIVHGDAKPANFCFARPGRDRSVLAAGAVAAVDFQYVGGGPGIVDVAYLLHGASAAETDRALDTYFELLAQAIARHASANANANANANASTNARDVEDEWRSLHPIAVADFDRFLAGWRG